MKLYNRSDFLKLKTPFIYSKINDCGSELMIGLFCNLETLASGDFVEQDLLSEPGFPLADMGVTDGFDNFLYVEKLRDRYEDFKIDLHCAGREGCFDPDFKAVVWDKKDLSDLQEYISMVINSMI